MGKFTEYSLPLKTLSPGEHVFEFALDKKLFADMESADIRDAALKAVVTVNYHNDLYDLNFKIDGEVTVQCDRCLDEMQWPIDAEYHIAVKYGDSYRDDSDELLEIPESAQSLNVAYMIYDTVSLAIPIKHVHPLGKCNRQMSAMLRKHRARSTEDGDQELEDTLMDEMDSMDSASQNTNPRWNALKDIATDGGDSED